MGELNAVRRVMPSNPAQAQLDALVSWYEQNRPGQAIDIRVQLERSTCERFCTQLNRSLFYRGYRIIPVDDTVRRGAGDADAAQ